MGQMFPYQMPRADYFSPFAWLCVRLVLALLLIFAVLGLFQAPIPLDATQKPWIGPNAPTLIPVWVYVPIFIGCALLLVSGWKVAARGNRPRLDAHRGERRTAGA